MTRPPWPRGWGSRLRLLAATCGGLGFAPIAPGLFGSLAGLALVAGLAALGAPPRLAAGALAAALTLLAVPLGSRLARDYNSPDPPWFVLDEAAGMALALSCGPELGPGVVVAVLILFRALDVVKPPPIAHAERLPGGAGITADDLIAGAAAGLAVRGAFAGAALLGLGGGGLGGASR